MKKLITTIIVAIVTFSTVMASEAETKLENELEKSIYRLESSLKKFRAMKVAIPTEDVDREAILRKVCTRMKNETSAVNLSLAQLDFCLEIGHVRTSGNELKRSKKDIKSLKNQIEELKKTLDHGETPTMNVAAK